MTHLLILGRNGFLISNNHASTHRVHISCHFPCHSLFYLAATISPNECERLNDYLGPKTPGGCFVLGHNDGDDPFTHGVEKGETPFQGKDATHHRNSWLWPKLARRVTKNSDLHQSRWRRPVEVSGDECNRIYNLLKLKLEDSQEALDELPVGCKKFVMS